MAETERDPRCGEGTGGLFAPEEGIRGAAVRGATRPSTQGGYEYITGRGACAWPHASPSSCIRGGSRPRT